MPLVRKRPYKLRGKSLQLTQKLGAIGGKKNSEAQQLARQRNIYRALKVKYPASVKVALKLKELEAQR